MNKIVKDALILFAITLVAGVLLGFVYDITKDPIAAQNEKAKQEAYKEVMADADSFEALSGDAYSEANITATFAAALQADAENYTADEITEVVAGVKARVRTVHTSEHQFCRFQKQLVLVCV